jgi:hypothetical protein
MRRWTRAISSCFCGACGLSIAAGEPMLLVALSGLTRGLRRCPECAGELVNEEQIEAEDVRLERADVTTVPARPARSDSEWTATRALAAHVERDWRWKREPEED